MLYFPKYNPDTTEESMFDSRETDNEVKLKLKLLIVTQAKWPTKETYAIIHAIKTLYFYFYGSYFTIVTEHKPLEYLMNKK